MENTITKTIEKDRALKDAIGEDVFNQLEQQIKTIEESIPTTKNHYGKYMTVLSNFKDHKQQIAMILIYLGANIEGIKSALEVLK